MLQIMKKPIYFQLEGVDDNIIYISEEEATSELGLAQTTIKNIRNFIPTYIKHNERVYKKSDINILKEWKIKLMKIDELTSILYEGIVERKNVTAVRRFLSTFSIFAKFSICKRIISPLQKHILQSILL